MKYTVSSYIAMTSTMLGLFIVGALKMGVFTTIDASVNMVCLILMTRVWKTHYWRLCGPLLRLLSSLTCFGQEQRGDISHLIHYYGSQSLNPAEMMAPHSLITASNTSKTGSVTIESS